MLGSAGVGPGPAVALLDALAGAPPGANDSAFAAPLEFRAPEEARADPSAPAGAAPTSPFRPPFPPAPPVDVAVAWTSAASCDPACAVASAFRPRLPRHLPHLPHRFRPHRHSLLRKSRWPSPSPLRSTRSPPNSPSRQRRPIWLEQQNHRRSRLSRRFRPKTSPRPQPSQSRSKSSLATWPHRRRRPLRASPEGRKQRWHIWLDPGSAGRGGCVRQVSRRRRDGRRCAAGSAVWAVSCAICAMCAANANGAGVGGRSADRQ
jgi:hypothetical protein